MRPEIKTIALSVLIFKPTSHKHSLETISVGHSLIYQHKQALALPEMHQAILLK
jgi:hypothetical protein